MRVGLSVGALVATPLARAAEAATVPGDYPTIQAAINAVVNGSLPDGTTIDVQPGIYAEALVVANTPRSFTVRGAGAASLTIVDAVGLGAPVLRVFRATGTVRFVGLTFRRGAPPGLTHGGGFIVQEASPAFVNCIFEASAAYNGGGGALISSNATFIGCVFRNNSAAHFGGGVFIIHGSRPVFTGCDITGNASGTGGAGVGNNGAGGGVFSHDASPTFRGARVNGNTSKFAAGGIFHMGMFDSAYGRSILVVEDSEIADNVSSQFPGEPNPAEGGGFHVEDNATATLTRVRVLRNLAGTGGGLNAYRARYDVVDSVIDANRATAGFGGGITASSNFATPQMPPSMINLTTTLVRNNAAPIGAGIAVIGDNYSNERTTLSLTSSVVSGNQSQSQGGGILVSRSVLGAANSLIINNTVSGGGNPYGGGILLSMSAASISGTTIAHNTAGQHGGGLFLNDQSSISMNFSHVYGNAAGTRGGGLFLGVGQSGTIQNSIIADNTGVSPNSQIHEDACNAVNYPNNLITAPALSGCASIASRAPGMSSGNPRFAHFLAVPASGTSVTLAWSVARATSVTISGVGTFNNVRTGTADVTPSASGGFTLTATASSANGGNYGPVTAGFVVVQPPVASGRKSDGDFDGDGRSDVSVFRPLTGQWHILRSSTQTGIAPTWGGGGDIPLRGDFDGDGRADLAVFRPSTGAWLIVRSSASTGLTQTWGGGGDIPVPRDYDGDGKTDIAIFRPSTGAWWIINSSTGIGSAYTFGGGGDVPVPEDYDGDGKADVAIFRPATGAWYIVRSSNQSGIVLTWGGGGDVPVPSDYDGDGRADIAVFRRTTGNWHIIRSSTQTGSTVTWGGGTDVAVPGDYDGDGRADVAVFRPSTGAWYIVQSSTLAGATYTWGGGSDIPILRR
jgi:FG-GAP-like repeat